MDSQITGSSRCLRPVDTGSTSWHWRAEPDVLSKSTNGFRALQITKQEAVAMQIDAALNLERDGNIPAAITLAAAAEGAMPPAKDETLWNHMKSAYSQFFRKNNEKQTAAYLNTHRDWLKHYNTDQSDELNFEHGASFYIMRVISRYHAVYGFEAETETMKEYFFHARLDIE